MPKFPTPKPPIWLDNNILVHIDAGGAGFANAETIIGNLQKQGHEVLISKAVELEFLNGSGSIPADYPRRTAILKRLQVNVDKMASQVPMQQLREWRDAGTRHGLSMADADVVAQVRAGAQARGIRNPVFLTRDTGGTLTAMRRRGVLAIDIDQLAVTSPPHMPTPKAPLPAPDAPPAAPDVPPAPPAAGAGVSRASAIKAGFKAGIREAFSAASLASLAPDIILVIADKVAAEEAIRNIEVKFIKEGFAKGVAAGAIGWTNEEVQSNLKNRVTNFRLKDMGDPAGFLTLSYMLQLAENYENYAVDVGYQYSYEKTLTWKKEMASKGLSVLKKYGYHFGTDPAALFEFEFVDKLAWVLRPTTDAIVGPAIRFNK